MYFPVTRFVDPFFSDTILKYKSLLENSGTHSVTSLTFLNVYAQKTDPVLPPCLLVFHTSRCGSTLLSQALCVPDRHLVLSEVPFLDDLFRLEDKLTEEQITTLASSFIRILLLGKQISTLILKVDCWHIFKYTWYKKIFPEATTIFLYRDPISIRASHLRKKGMHMIPGFVPAEWSGINMKIEDSQGLEQFEIRMLESYYEAMWTHELSNPDIMLLEFNGNADVLLTKTIEHAKFSFSSEELHAMYERKKFHSKEPSLVFTESATLIPDTGVYPHYYKLKEAENKKPLNLIRSI